MTTKQTKRARGFQAPLGVVLERKLSPIDGAPVVVIMTLQSSNRKTGNLPQVWILREDLHPVEALQQGADESICGQCPHRRQADGSRSCYVNVGQAPSSVWKTYRAGRYVELADVDVATVTRAIGSRAIRWGAYGDPAVISPEVVALVTSWAGSHRGYTHQWRQPWAQWARSFFMASCDSLMDYVDASGAGWKTFRVVAKGQQAEAGKQCPATVAGSQAQCRTCTQCDAAHGHVWVEAHGSGAKHVAAA